jgi:hypothetical protein
VPGTRVQVRRVAAYPRHALPKQFPAKHIEQSHGLPQRPNPVIWGLVLGADEALDKSGDARTRLAPAAVANASAAAAQACSTSSSIGPASPRMSPAHATRRGRRREEPLAPATAAASHPSGGLSPGAGNSHPVGSAASESIASRNSAQSLTVRAMGPARGCSPPPTEGQDRACSDATGLGRPRRARRRGWAPIRGGCARGKCGSRPPHRRPRDCAGCRLGLGLGLGSGSGLGRRHQHHPHPRPPPPGVLTEVRAGGEPAHVTCKRARGASGGAAGGEGGVEGV